MNSEKPLSTSSIGAVWPPIPTNNERRKGFYPEVVDEISKLDALEESFWESHDDEDLLGRTTVRFVATPYLLQQSIRRRMPIEAVMPVAGSSELQIVYIAANGIARLMSSDDIDRHKKVITSSKSATSVLSTNRVSDVEIRIVTGSEDTAQKLRKEFTDLYATFGFNEDDVIELLGSPNNTISYAESERGEVLSTCLAENGVVRLGDCALSLYEITEAVTRPDMRGKGLYTRVSGALERKIVRENSREDLSRGLSVAVYGESNLSSPGVIYAARRNGRKIVADKNLDFERNLPEKYGVLEQNYKVNDGSDARLYNDFALSYQPLD